MTASQQESKTHLRLVGGLERTIQNEPIDEHIISTEPGHLEQVTDLFRYSNKGIKYDEIKKWTIKSHEESERYQRDLHRVYQHEGEIYGAISCVLTKDGKGPYVLIDDVVATPKEEIELRAKAKAAELCQIGTKLIKSIEQRCIELEIPRMCLYVNVENTKAIECYERLGFETHGKIVSIDNDPDYVPGIPMYLMEKELKLRK